MLPPIVVPICCAPWWAPYVQWLAGILLAVGIVLVYYGRDEE